MALKIDGKLKEKCLGLSKMFNRIVVVLRLKKV